jgi:hypothetical protein
MEIENQAVRTLLGYGGEGGRAIVEAGGIEAFGCQQHDERIPHGIVVVNDEDRPWRCWPTDVSNDAGIHAATVRNRASCRYTGYPIYAATIVRSICIEAQRRVDAHGSTSAPTEPGNALMIIAMIATVVLGALTILVVHHEILRITSAVAHTIA